MKKAYGNALLGTWTCPKCKFEIFPMPLEKAKDEFKWGIGAAALKHGYVGPLCPACNISMEYDEEG